MSPTTTILWSVPCDAPFTFQTNTEHTNTGQHTGQFTCHAQCAAPRPITTHRPSLLAVERRAPIGYGWGNWPTANTQVEHNYIT